MTDPQLAVVMAALGHGLRLRLWRMLQPYGTDGLPAGMIATKMSVVPSSLSFHLRQMTQAGVLVQRRSSRQIIYAVNSDIIQRLIGLLSDDQPITSSSLSIHSSHFMSDGLSEG